MNFQNISWSWSAVHCRDLSVIVGYSLVLVMSVIGFVETFYLFCLLGRILLTELPLMWHVLSLVR